MWQATKYGRRIRRRRHRPDDVDPLAGRDDDAQAGHVRRHAHDRRRPGRRPVRPGLGGRPGVLGRHVADDRLVGGQAAVDDVEQDRLARARGRARPAGTSSPS